MKEHPILFDGEMVRAILGRYKTRTRRVIKPQPAFANNAWHWKNICWGVGGAQISDEFIVDHCPYGKPGDHLWVRETWRQHHPETSYSKGIVYRADAPRALGMGSHSDSYKWKPSSYMPRWASRITLEITGVRVEKLQEITSIDAVREGIQNGAYAVNPVRSFRRLWDSTNKTKGYNWDENPWVWVVEFKKLEVENDQ